MADSTNEIGELMRRVRAGDPSAAERLVRDYEPFIRRMVRMKLEDDRLQRVFDSMDVCQSVLGSFFVRAGLGEYEVNEPGQLINLLITMTKNKVASAARREYRQKRDQRRAASGDTQQMGALPAAADSPSMIAQGKELLDRAKALMRDDEKRIAELRALGHSWEEIGERLGGTAQARRVQFARATERVLEQLGIDE